MKKMAKLVVVGLLSGVALAAWGDDPVAPATAGLVPTASRGRWTFSAGPAWRSRVTIDTRGTAYAQPLTIGASHSSSTTGSKVDLDQTPTALGVSEHRSDPAAGQTVPEGQERWAATETFVQSDVTRTVDPGVTSWTCRDSDTDSPMGLHLQGGYDFLQGRNWSVSLGLRFAGYWNMRSSASGRVGGGSVRETTVTTVTKNSYLYCDDPYTGVRDDDLYDFSRVSDMSSPTYVDTDSRTDSEIIEQSPVRCVSTRFRGDLYQIGLGPKVSWTPFADVCGWMEWLDIYGGVEVLCNIAHSRLDADGRSATQTDCLIGFGGNVGFVGNLTDWCGIYGQVGYEWVDENDVSVGAFTADIDYSSLVLSVGLQFRF